MTTDIQGSGTYRISRVIGNNFVCTVDETGREVILRGLGIGFKKKPDVYKRQILDLGIPCTG